MRLWKEKTREFYLFKLREKGIRPDQGHPMCLWRTLGAGVFTAEVRPFRRGAGEALEALRVGENSLYWLLNSGKLKAYKNGRNWLIPKEAMRQFVMEQAKMM